MRRPGKKMISSHVSYSQWIEDLTLSQTQNGYVDTLAAISTWGVVKGKEGWSIRTNSSTNVREMEIKNENWMICCRLTGGIINLLQSRRLSTWNCAKLCASCLPFISHLTHFFLSLHITHEADVNNNLKFDHRQTIVKSGWSKGVKLWEITIKSDEKSTNQPIAIQYRSNRREKSIGNSIQFHKQTMMVIDIDDDWVVKEPANVSNGKMPIKCK